ncbi:hypothetical protein VOLCADRAFT_99939, partial [Volvox carteri f. nagariensis]
MMRDEAPPAFQGRGAGAPCQLPSRPARLRRRRRRLPPREETTLVCLIKSLVERKVVVELRNDILLRGRLDDVDDFLNMSLSEVTFQTVDVGARGFMAGAYCRTGGPSVPAVQCGCVAGRGRGLGYKTEYESIFVKGRNVRFVHLPRSLDPAKAIEAYRHKVIRAKLEAARERARALGSAKSTPKGQDALVPEAMAADVSESAAAAADEAMELAGEDDDEGHEGGGGEGDEDEEEGEDEEAGEEDWEQQEEEESGGPAAAAGAVLQA